MNFAEDLRLRRECAFLAARVGGTVAEAIQRLVFFAQSIRYEWLGPVCLAAMSAGEAAIACWYQGIGEIAGRHSNGWLIEEGRFHFAHQAALARSNREWAA